MNYSIEHPTAYKKSNKPVKTHLDEIQFKKSGGTEVGTYYTILRHIMYKFRLDDRKFLTLMTCQKTY